MIGQTIGAYSILARLGEGGMGEVYRARDARLNRDVAIKVLLPSVANDPDRLARFSREAQVLASLNHPNIAAIYGIEESAGVTALVMELVEGEDLSQRISRGAIPIDEALPIARQIAEALEAAHDHGIIHRDLKPANINIRDDGTVKVLDFGLAKAMEPAAGSSVSMMNSPTLSIHATQAGIILGTAAYMSPEQARGKSVDKRTDIWAFGVVLYEMVTARRLFEGETVSDTLAAVLTREPDWHALPPTIQRLLRRCLEKDPKRRLRDIGDAMELLDETSGTTRTPTKRSRLAPSLGALAAVSTLVAVGLAFQYFREPQPAAQRVQFEMLPPGNATFGNSLSVAPDGRQIAFIAQQQIWVRALDSAQMKPLAGTGGLGTTILAWSPDSRFVLFATLSMVRKIDVLGGPPQTICACANVRGGAWSPAGVILLAGADGIMRSTDTGGATTPIISAELAGLGKLFFLNDGDHFLYGMAGGIHLGSLAAPVGSASKQHSNQPLMASDAATFFYASSADGRGGHILLQNGGTLMAQPFDDDTLTVAGPAVPIAHNVGVFGASSTGVLAYRPNQATMTSQLLWYGRDGKPLGRLGPAASYGNLQLSRDGKTVMLDRFESRTGNHMWAGDLARGVFSRPNPLESLETGPCALPDGRVAFTFASAGIAGDIYVSAAYGAGPPEAWVKSANVKHVNQCSPDGRFLIYDDHNGAQNQDLWVLPVNPPASGPRQPIPFLVTAADETFGQFSPNGQWVAYSSDETGRREVYVRDFAADRVPAVGAGKWLVSTDGGDKPRWSSDGRELYYLAPDGKLMAVPVTRATVFAPGIPVPLFAVATTGFMPFDVSSDGRFLINTPNADSATPMTVILNWFVELKP